MNHGYLTLAQITGEPDELLSGYRSSAATMDGVGRDHGLIVHAAAATPAGLLIVNLWPSRAASEEAARDPRRLGAIREHDLVPAQMNREHHEVERFVLFEREASGVA